MIVLPDIIDQKWHGNSLLYNKTYRIIDSIVTFHSGNNIFIKKFQVEVLEERRIG